MTTPTLIAGNEELPTIAFLEEAARYFASRPTGGEDSAHWSNVYNAENCLKAADIISKLLGAFRPFVGVHTQFPETVKLISPSFDGLSPLTIIVTKAQFLAALEAIARAQSTGEPV